MTSPDEWHNVMTCPGEWTKHPGPWHCPIQRHDTDTWRCKFVHPSSLKILVIAFKLCSVVIVIRILGICYTRPNALSVMGHWLTIQLYFDRQYHIIATITHKFCRWLISLVWLQQMLTRHLAVISFLFEHNTCIDWPSVLHIATISSINWDRCGVSREVVSILLAILVFCRVMSSRFYAVVFQTFPSATCYCRQYVHIIPVWANQFQFQFFAFSAVFLAKPFPLIDANYFWTKLIPRPGLETPATHFFCNVMFWYSKYTSFLAILSV